VTGRPSTEPGHIGRMRFVLILTAGTDTG